MRDLMARNWRGNVRELRAYLEQAVIMSDEGLLDKPLSPTVGGATEPGLARSTQPELQSLHCVVEDAERAHIRKALNRCEGSVGKTADLLGISRKTLWEKMKRLAISA